MRYDFKELLRPLRQASIEDLLGSAPLLNSLSTPMPKSYCEFGTRQGDRFIYTVEYLIRMSELTFGSKEEFWYADAIGVKDSPKLRAYCEYNPKCRFLITNGDPEDLYNFIHRRLDYDLVVIDKMAVDLEVIFPRAKMVRRLL